jgi:hypothetical protein
MRNFKYSEYNDFGESIGENVLDLAIAWVQKNCVPEDIFDESDLKGWAEDRSPESIFDEDKLAEWADDNGFVKEKS